MKPKPNDFLQEKMKSNLINLSEIHWSWFTDFKITKAKIGCTERVHLEYISSASRNDRIKRQRDLKSIENQVFVFN